VLRRTMPAALTMLALAVAALAIAPLAAAKRPLTRRLVRRCEGSSGGRYVA
jgi:hypothetical protein